MMWLATLVLLSACGPVPSEPAPDFAKGGPGGGTKYKVRFITGINPAGDGEIVSDWMPSAGIALNTGDPWKSLSLSSADISLVNFTHGSWTEGSCATYAPSKQVNVTNWDIHGTSPVLTFAGTYRGNFSLSRARTGYQVAFDGDRVVEGTVVPASGGIHNVVSGGNVGYETSSGTDWFRLELRSSAWQFGSGSSPDGVTNPVGVEAACVNLTIEARKVSLITP
jgi:hypothetical protein